ncbi:hypothetical protein [Dendronalium phyllosphericum]|uniref:hypothetical protein n=1 Tax=Dendronalium phyllosphericum TaxID=2840445 RepID=UPI0030D81F9E
MNIYKGDKQILRRQLIAVADNAVSVVPTKLVTWCNVVNIKSGQLALRYSPNGLCCMKQKKDTPLPGEIVI